MKIKTGYLYHIKDEFFDIVNDENIMTNHERGKKRPTYFTIKDKDILWFIPLSSKVDKYKKIVDKKLKKYGVCNSILIKDVLGNESAILIQNAFPTLEKYIDHVHILDNGEPARVISSTCDEILENFIQMLKLKSKGINLFFTDIDKIKQQMLNELYNTKIKPSFDGNDKFSIFSINNRMEDLESLINQESFYAVYYVVLEKIRLTYSKINGIIDLPIMKIEKLYNDYDYAQKYISSSEHKLPNDEFIKMYLECMKIDDRNIMYERLKRLYEFSFGNLDFDPNNFELKFEDKSPFRV